MAFVQKRTSKNRQGQRRLQAPRGGGMGQPTHEPIFARNYANRLDARGPGDPGTHSRSRKLRIR